MTIDKLRQTRSIGNTNVFGHFCVKPDNKTMSSARFLSSPGNGRRKIRGCDGHIIQSKQGLRRNEKVLRLDLASPPYIDHIVTRCLHLEIVLIHIPWIYIFLILFRGSYNCSPQLVLLRDQNCARCQMPLTGIDDRWDVKSQKRQNAVQIRNHDSCALRQQDASREILNKGDVISIAIFISQSTGNMNSIARFYGIYMTGAKSTG